jgi:hypothetical protein
MRSRRPRGRRRPRGASATSSTCRLRTGADGDRSRQRPAQIDPAGEGEDRDPDPGGCRLLLDTYPDREIPDEGRVRRVDVGDPWTVMSASQTACEVTVTTWRGASPHLIPPPGWVPNSSPFCTPACAVGPSVEQNDRVTGAVASPTPITPSPAAPPPDVKASLSANHTAPTPGSISVANNATKYSSPVFKSVNVAGVKGLTWPTCTVAPDPDELTRTSGIPASTPMAKRLMVSAIIPRPIPRILIDCPPLLTLLRSGRHRGIGATRGSIGELSVAEVRWAMTSTSTTKCLYLAIEGGCTQRRIDRAS